MIHEHGDNRWYLSICHHTVVVGVEVQCNNYTVLGVWFTEYLRIYFFN